MKFITSAMRVRNCDFASSNLQFRTSDRSAVLFVSSLVILRSTNSYKKVTCRFFNAYHFWSFFLPVNRNEGAVIDPITCPFAMLTGSYCHRKCGQRLLANCQVAFINNMVIIYCKFLPNWGFTEFSKFSNCLTGQ